MSIHWSAFYQQAEDLFLQAKDEADDTKREALFRSSASRAYYSVFHRADHVISHVWKLTLPVNTSHHAFTWNSFNGRSFSAIKNNGHICHTKRKVADYDIDQPYGQTEAWNCIDCALGLHEDMDDIPTFTGWPPGFTKRNLVQSRLADPAPEATGSPEQS